MAHTILLTERRTRECRLTPGDVDFLLARHSDHLDVIPTRERHRYRLTPRGHIGVIATPSRRIVIRPKVSGQNLFHLLDPAADVKLFAETAAGFTGTEALNFLALRFAQLLDERTIAGLHRGYVEHETTGSFLQGQLDVPAQRNEPAVRKDILHSRHDNLTLDVPCNQVPRSTGDLLLASPYLADAVRLTVRQALQPLDEVRSVPLEPGLFTLAASNRLAEGYRPLLELCRLLADGLAPTVGVGAGPAFLIDMDRVFERYVTRGIISAFADRPGVVLVQPFCRTAEAMGDQPSVDMRPDIAIRGGDGFTTVIDAKWKRLPGTRLLTEDLYQVLAYGTVLGAPQAVLVYPGRRERVWRYHWERSPVAVEVRTVCVVGEREKCERSMRQFTAALLS